MAGYDLSEAEWLLIDRTAEQAARGARVDDRPVIGRRNRCSMIRQLDHEGPPARGRKKGGPDHAIGRSRGELSAKIHAVVDQDGLPVRFLLSPGQASDVSTVSRLLAGLPAPPWSSPIGATIATLSST